MHSYTYTALIHPTEPDETGFWVEVPALPGCFSQGETLEHAVAMVREAILCYLEGLAIDQTLPPFESGLVEAVDAVAKQITVMV